MPESDYLHRLSSNGIDTTNFKIARQLKSQAIQSKAAGYFQSSSGRLVDNWKNPVGVNDESLIIPYYFGNGFSSTDRSTIKKALDEISYV